MSSIIGRDLAFYFFSFVLFLNFDVKSPFKCKLEEKITKRGESAYQNSVLALSHQYDEFCLRVWLFGQKSASVLENNDGRGTTREKGKKSLIKSRFRIPAQQYCRAPPSATSSGVSFLFFFGLSLSTRVFRADKGET